MNEENQYPSPQPNSQIDSLQAAEADPGTRTAQFTYDDAIACVDDILGATAAIGYISSVLIAGEGS